MIKNNSISLGAVGEVELLAEILDSIGTILFTMRRIIDESSDSDFSDIEVELLVAQISLLTCEIDRIAGKEIPVGSGFALHNSNLLKSHKQILPDIHDEKYDSDNREHDSLSVVLDLSNLELEVEDDVYIAAKKIEMAISRVEQWLGALRASMTNS